MLKKLLLAAAAGALLLPVGLALSNTGGKGLVHGGSQPKCAYYAKHKVAHAAGGTQKKCVVVVRTTVTRTKTVYLPVTVTRTSNHSTTTTRSYTSTKTYTTPVTGYTTTTRDLHIHSAAHHGDGQRGGHADRDPGGVNDDQDTIVRIDIVNEFERVTVNETVTRPADDRHRGGLMLRKILIAVVAGALLSPVGLALSQTGGKGLAPRGGSTQQCSKKARAAGGSYVSCVVTVRTTITKYKTLYKPVTSTKTIDGPPRTRRASPQRRPHRCPARR